MRRACAAFFTGAGVLHFVIPRQYERVVPPGFGDPSTVVRISGIAEIAGGVALTQARSHKFARWWLLGLLVAVFPANVHMALSPEEIGVRVPRPLLWARLPLQPLMMLWVWRVTAAAREATPEAR
jgi:uncharacterized membrane protein